MARLNEVVSGMLRDLVESRVAADGLSREHAQAYWADPVLSQFPVPRFAIKEATLKLRFAVDEVQTTGGTANPAPVREAWAREMLASVLPGALKAARLDAESSAALLKRLERSAATLDVKALIAGKASEAAAAAVKWMLDARGALPAAPRDKLKLQALRGAVAADVQAAAVAFVPRARQIVVSEGVLRSRLDIAIKRADLAQVPESQVHELTLTFSTDDLQPGGAPAAGTEPKRG